MIGSNQLSDNLCADGSAQNAEMFKPVDSAMTVTEEDFQKLTGSL